MSKSTALQPEVTVATPNIVLKPSPVIRSSVPMSGRVAVGGNQTVTPPPAA